MQTEAQHHDQSAPKEGYSSKNDDQALNEQFLNLETREMPKEGSDWLDKEFQRFSYKLYISWMVLTFGAVGFILYAFLKDIWTRFPKEHAWILDNLILNFAFYNAIQLILLFGCSEILFGMMKKKAEIAQKGIIKLQISMIGSLLSSFGEFWGPLFEFDRSNLLARIFIILLPLIIAINLVGGFAVLKAFKNNHPLARSRDSQGIQTDFLQQNEMIAAEILKFDEQLDQWPYLIYKFWLVAFSLWIIYCLCDMILRFFMNWSLDRITLEMICELEFLFLNGAGSYEMLFALRRKILARLKRALFLLKICFSVTIILAVIAWVVKEEISTIFARLASVLWAPSITLIGALKAKKILEQRDEFAKISSYNDNSYI